MEPSSARPSNFFLGVWAAQRARLESHALERVGQTFQRETDASAPRRRLLRKQTVTPMWIGKANRKLARNHRRDIRERPSRLIRPNYNVLR